MRLVPLSAALFLVLAVLAGTSAGSNPRGPRATEPRLIAHDLSTFGGSVSEPEPLRGLRRATAKLAGPRLFNDSRLAASNVLNPTLDVSRTQVLVGQNGTYSLYSRTQNLLAQVSASSFWGGFDGPDAASLCATDAQGEPTVAYDWVANRWVISEAAYAVDSGNAPTGPDVQCVAVSTSPDAEGTWSRYVFQVSTSLYAERPQLGVWSDAYYLSFDQLDSQGAFAGAGALALERSKMLTGAAAQARYFDLSGVTPRLGGMLPASITGANAPAANAVEPYMQFHDDPANINDRVEIWGFHVDWTAPVTGSTFQPVVNIPLNSGGFTYDTHFLGGVSEIAPGGVGSVELDPLATAYDDGVDLLPQLGGPLQWSRTGGGNETMSFAMTVDVGGAAQSAWFRLQNLGGAGWGLGSRGVVNAGDGRSRFLPSAVIDNSGNFGIAYVRTSGTEIPRTAYTNATGGLFAENTINAGSASFSGSSGVFGGQTRLALDPVDSCTLWFAGPLPQGTVSFGDFTFPGCSGSVAQPPLLTADPTWTAALVREGLSITGNDATFTGATGTTYQWRRCDVRGLNCVDIVGANASTYLMTAADASGTHTLRFMEIGTNANGSSKATSTATSLVQSIPPANTVLPVISGTAQAGQTLSTTNGTWTSSSPVSYTYRWRRCSAGACANIGGANTSTYTLTNADVASTVDVVVSATNTGGGTDANATATSTVTSAPASGGSSGGGGGGGGGGGKPDLVVTASASASAPKSGDRFDVYINVNDKNLNPASAAAVSVALSTGLQLVASSTDRGSGCVVVGSGSLTCSLAFLSGDAPVGNVRLTLLASADTGLSVTATASASEGVLTATNSTYKLAFGAGSTTTSTSGVPAGLNGGGTTSTTVADKKAPSARALSSAGSRGRAAKLKFRIYDDRGTAKALVTVKRNGKVIGSAKTGFGPVAFGSTYYVGWQVPRSAAKGTYSFCVVAYDRASNHSKASCAPLAVR